MYQRKALYHLRHTPSPWLFLSSNKSSFQDREKLGPSALPIVPTLCHIPGAGERGKCSAWQMIQHQELDPLKITLVASCFPRLRRVCPASCPSVLHFQHPGSLLSSGSSVSSETQLGEQCVNGSIYHLVWLASSLGMGARGQGKELVLRLWGSVWDLGKCICWEPCECPNIGK